MVFNKSKQNLPSIQKGLTLDSLTSKNTSISKCLQEIKSSWKQKNKIAGLMQDWGKIAGTQLAANCIPISLLNKTLVIGASHPQWRQALLYNKLQLLKALNAEGYSIKEIRIQQYHSTKAITKTNEKIIWDNHPSRSDLQGVIKCSECGSPSPKGEIKLWGKCIFCRRKDL